MSGPFEAPRGRVGNVGLELDYQFSYLFRPFDKYYAFQRFGTMSLILQSFDFRFEFSQGASFDTILSHCGSGG
jgi:hypothetical protein